MNRSISLISTLIILFIASSCGTEDCTSWYSGLKFHAATKKWGNGDRWFNYRATDFLEGKLNFLFIPHYSQDGYEECATVTMKHTLLAESMSITSAAPIIIDDTISTGTNIISFFKISENHGNYLFEFDTPRYNLPRFQSQYNKFYFTAPLSDSTFLKDSVIVKIQ